MYKKKVVKILWQIAGFLLVAACAALPSSAQTCSTFVTAKPTNVIFGPQTVGTTSAAQTVTFNVTTTCLSAPVTLHTFTPGGANASEFGATGSGTSPCTQPITLTASSDVAASCTVGVTFTPTITSTRSATLSFAYTFGTDTQTFTQTVNLVGGDEVVFVSTQSGGQILKVDGTTGAFSVVSGNPGFSEGFSPEGMVVGPDGKLYITVPNNGQVVRMNQDGTQPELIYNLSNCVLNVCPGAPQGPSFSSSATGDLYFNTENRDSGSLGVFAITGVGATLFGGEINGPSNVVPGTCPTGGPCFSPGYGAGTAFDNTDNLLFVEQAGGSNPNSVLSVSPPYTTGNNPTTLVSGLTNPTAVALNKATGQLFVSNTGTQQILAIGSGNTTTPYFTFTTTTFCRSDFALPDLPVFMQFDGTGHLFVVTTTNPLFNGCGKVWRIDPGTTPTATLLVDLSTVSGLNSSQAIGLALPGTPGQTQSTGLSSAAGSFNFGWPFGCDPRPTPNKCSYTFGIAYPANMFPDGSMATVTPNETSQAAWALRTPPGNGYFGTQIAQVEGYGGDGFIFLASCTTSGGSACPPSAQNYTTTATWQSADTNYCTSGPQLLKGDPIGSDNWVGTLISCIETADPQPKNTGGSCCTLSEWPNVKGVTGAAPTIVITTPAQGAIYTLGQIVNSNFSCTGPTLNSMLPNCIGTQPGPPLTTVLSGNPIDTSTTGTKTLTVNALVSSGPGAAQSVTYQVVPGAVASLSPTSVNFGNVRVGRFAFRIVTVTNTGTASLNITSVKVASVSGRDSDDFFAFSLCPKTLLPTKSCIILVGFFADEVAVNPQSATLTITDNAAGSPQRVPLTATVVKSEGE